MFGQIVIGPPGSGKSTYCYGMYQFLSAIGRKLCVVNLDPANDRLPYPNCELDIRDYITVDEIMEELNLGPNGSLLYAMENLNDTLIEEFISQINKLIQESNYLIFDCPGQVELFTHDNSLYKIFKQLSKRKDLRLCCVSLIDSIYLTSPSQYVSILLLSLRSMLQMNLPQINVISKIDKLKEYGSLPFKLDYYTEVQDLKYLLPHLEKEFNTPLSQRYINLTQTIGDIIEDFNLVSFEVLSVENKQSMINLLSIIDKANGYSFGYNEVGGDTIWNDVIRASGKSYIDVDIHERWVENKELHDQQELKDFEEFQEKLKAENADTEIPMTEDEKWEQELQAWESNRTKDALKR